MVLCRRGGSENGKPKSTRNKTTLAVEALLEGAAETLTRKEIELAKAGDFTALRVCLDRIAPYGVRGEWRRQYRRADYLLQDGTSDERCHCNDGHEQQADRKRN